MENEKNVKKYTAPKLEIIHLTEKDIITTSGEPWEEIPEEGEKV